jgi:hypothetical protein
MDRKIICLLVCLGLLLGGCITPGSNTAGSGDRVRPGSSVRQGHELTSTVDAPSLAANVGAENDLVFNPREVESALPQMRDLPLPAPLKKEKPTRLYTGIIKNKTNYDVSVPSGNSGATLAIPAKGWIEYSAWTSRFELTAYHNGKPFYCMKIVAEPRAHPFMCKKYDFMMEIVKPEPKPEKKMKKAIKKKKKDGVEASG